MNEVDLMNGPRQGYPRWDLKSIAPKDGTIDVSGQDTAFIIEECVQ